MKKQLLSSVAALTLLDISAANAIEPTPSWTGFYVGTHLGYSWGAVTGDTATDVHAPFGLGFGNPGTLVFSFDRDLKPNGALGGGQFGYNNQIGSAVFGFETDFSWTGQRDTFNFNGSVFITSEDYVYHETLRAKLQYMGTVRGRFGYAFGQFLPYVTGGFAGGHVAADLNSSLTQLFGPTQTIVMSQSKTLVGWTIGGGFEYALARQWSIKAEYLFIDLGKQTFFVGQSGGAFGLQDHIFRLGINFRN